MNAHTDTASELDRSNDKLITRIGGVAVLIAVAIHFVINSVLKEFPSWSIGEEELRTYFAEQFDTWAIVHGARYVAILAMVLFIAGLMTRVCSRPPVSKGWCATGLVGAAMLGTNLMITNGIETLSYLNLSLFRDNQELFWLLRNMTGTLFTGELVAWVLILLGFSCAGWTSKTLPKWIVYLGFVSAASGTISVVFLVNALTGGWARHFANAITPMTAIVWFLAVGVILLRRGTD